MVYRTHIGPWRTKRPDVSPVRSGTEPRADREIHRARGKTPVEITGNSPPELRLTHGSACQSSGDRGSSGRAFRWRLVPPTPVLPRSYSAARAWTAGVRP